MNGASSPLTGPTSEQVLGVLIHAALPYVWIALIAVLIVLGIDYVRQRRSAGK